MRRVQKENSPPEFEEWKSKESENWKPAYENLQNPEKASLHAALLVEQGWTCCYCGCSIEQNDSHIEHFIPQAKNPALDLDYENLHASCLRALGPGSPLRCGHAKADNLDTDLAISPLDQHCESRFTYRFDGSIRAAELNDDKAQYMIDLLQLDIAFLQNRRQEVLLRVFDPEFLANASEAELVLLRDEFSGKSNEGKIAAFGHVISCFAQKRLEEV